MGLAGVAAAAVGTRNVFLLSGGLVFVSGLLAFFLFREMRTGRPTEVGDMETVPARTQPTRE
jgi:hypothetical protein